MPDSTVEVLREKARFHEAMAKRYSNIADELDKLYAEGEMADAEAAASSRNQGQRRRRCQRKEPKHSGKPQRKPVSKSKNKSFPFGKPISQGGKFTNIQIVKNFLQKKKVATLKQIMKGTGMGQGSCSGVLSGEKAFVHDGEGNWTLA
jgi:hypothetical protein